MGLTEVVWAFLVYIVYETSLSFCSISDDLTSHVEPSLHLYCLILLFYVLRPFLS